MSKELKQSKEAAGRTIPERRTFLITAAATAVAAGVASVMPGFARNPGGKAGIRENPGVHLTDAGETFTLDNGIVAARIDKSSAAVVSIRYKGLELLGTGKKAGNGYWSMPGTNYSFGKNRASAVLHDPARNGGERATVSCRFSYDGGAHSVPADVEFIYSLARGEHALYMQAIWSHKAEYPALNFPVGRFAVKLNDDIFDWMTIDERRNLKMITADDWNHGTTLNMKEARLMNTGISKGQVEHKYDYSAVQFDTPAYGWSSTEHKVGMWMVTADYEYMSGGPTKVELTAHRDATFGESGEGPAAPVLLNVWKGPHYGGTSLSVAEGEDWSKSVGPFLLYCNSAATPNAMWKDALLKASREAKRWPYEWAAGTEYPGRAERGVVRGRILLKDPYTRQSGMKNLLVGLSHPDYSDKGNLVDWQTDGKYYQFWTRAESDGSFRIPSVRPGTYTLHAFADGVLGEYMKADITVRAGKVLDLGALKWTPVRFGRQLWEIGVPTRTAGEYLHGDHYWQWGLYNRYPKDFPDDVNFVIGKSDYRKDWNIMQVPRAKDDSGKGRGDETIWSILFDMKSAVRGKATLRIAFAGTEARSLAVRVNEQLVETLTGFRNTSAIHRDSNRSYWTERSVPFDAALLRAGRNVIKLTVPTGNVMGGVEYDYLRLELDENAAPPAGA